ncbi:MAG: hypothetical protein FWD53_06885 [Phycisphaerales bacterium]|nr:hypothetical protein [Phycisphaerales bacterium]
MKTINLLPDWYRRQQRQKKRLRLHLIAMILLGVGMLAGIGIGRSILHVAEAHRLELAARLENANDPEEKLQKRLTELERLKNLQATYRELGNTIPMSAVIQQIQNDMTTGMALSRVEIQIRSEKTNEIAHLNVVGVAPNDVQIAQLIGKLTSNPLFSEVALNYTRTETLRNCLVRRFEIQMQMDLDALAEEEPENAG